MLLLCMLLTAAAGCGSEEEPASPPQTAALAELIVSVDADGARGAQKPGELRVRCTSPQDGAACAAAAELRPEDLEPSPPDVACTDIFGGAQTARIAGMLRGDPVSARFSRSDGCEIRRWDAVAPLLEQVR